MVKVVRIVGDVDLINHIIDLVGNKIEFRKRPAMDIDHCMWVRDIAGRICLIGSIVRTPVAVFMEWVARGIIGLIGHRVVLNPVIYLVASYFIKYIDLVRDPFLIERRKPKAVVVVILVVEILPLLRKDRRVVLKCLEMGSIGGVILGYVWRIAIRGPDPLGITVVVAVELVVVQPLIDEDVHGVLRFLSQYLTDECFRLIHRRR